MNLAPSVLNFISAPFSAVYVTSRGCINCQPANTPPASTAVPASNDSIQRFRLRLLMVLDCPPHYYAIYPHISFFAETRRNAKFLASMLIDIDRDVCGVVSL